MGRRQDEAEDPETHSLSGLDADTRLVLVNAVCFKGMWVLQFRKAATRDEPFHLEGGGKVQAPLMHQHEEVRHLQAGGYQAVDLVYRGGDLSMLVLLPDRKDGLRDLEKTLSARMLHDCVAQMGTRAVKLFLPRFKITWGTVNVRDQLTALGMPLAFTRLQANFSGINGHEPSHEDSLFISAVFHKAFVETNEEGTEAAAATAVAIRTLGRPSDLRSRRQFPSSALTIHSCSPSAIGRAARSCFSGAWPIRRRRADVGSRCGGSRPNAGNRQSRTISMAENKTKPADAWATVGLGTLIGGVYMASLISRAGRARNDDLPMLFERLEAALARHVQ